MSNSLLHGFAIKHRKTNLVLDLKSTLETVEGLLLSLYHDLHHGPNQTFHFESGQIVSDMDPNLCIGAEDFHEVKKRNKIGIVKKDQNDSHWVVRDGVIRLKYRADYCLCSDGKNIFVCKGIDRWDLVPRAEDFVPRPATSCYLRYEELPEKHVKSHWTLECVVNVEQSADSTYFCVIGWYPGGYSGIQQIDSSTRVAIFSMWNDGKGGKLSPYSHGPKVKVSSFDGEGTGLKAMKRINWKEGQDVKMIVEGKKKLWSTSALVKRIKGSKKEIWIVSCWYELDGQRHFLASYKRHSSVKPLSPTGFYSFVEDWDRSVGAKGHNLCRMAIFKDVRVQRQQDPSTLVAKATFTKVENGLDSFAKHKAIGGPGSHVHSFYLSTGGPDEDFEGKPVVENGTDIFCD